MPRHKPAHVKCPQGFLAKGHPVLVNVVLKLGGGFCAPLLGLLVLLISHLSIGDIPNLQIRGYLIVGTLLGKLDPLG